MGVNLGLLQCGKNQVKGVWEEGAEGDASSLGGRKWQEIDGAAYWGASWSVLLTKYFSDDQIKKDQMGEACGTPCERKGMYRVWVAKLEGKRQRGWPRRRWERLDWMCLTQDIHKCGGGLVNLVMNLRVPDGPG